MSDTKAHWEEVYQNRSVQAVSWYQDKPELSLGLIQQTGIAKDDAIIDVGGGASTLIDYLLDAGYENLSVLDIAARALEHARQRLGDRADQVNWITADITAYAAAQTYALWHDRAVFHFLTDARDRARYIDTLEKSLQPGGHVIIAAFALNGPTQCSGLDIVQYDAEKLSNTLGPAFVLLGSESECHLTPDGREQNFGYYRYRYRS